MPALLTTASQIMCPHGGTVSATSSNAKAKAAGAYILRPSDTFIIAGCPFVIGTAAHPCVKVSWSGASKSKADGDTTLNQSSTGQCVAGDQAVQGAVLILSTQTNVAGQ